MRIFSKKAFTTFSKPNFSFNKCITEADSEMDYQCDFLNQSSIKFSAPPLESCQEEIEYGKLKETNQLKEIIKELELKVEELTRIVGQEKEENLLMNLNLKKFQEDISGLEKNLGQANGGIQTSKPEYDKFINLKNVLFNKIISINKEYEDKIVTLKNVIQMNEKNLEDFRRKIIEYKTDEEKSQKIIFNLTMQSSDKSKIIDELKKEIQTKEEIIIEATTKNLSHLKEQSQFNKDREPEDKIII